MFHMMATVTDLAEKPTYSDVGSIISKGINSTLHENSATGSTAIIVRLACSSLFSTSLDGIFTLDSLCKLPVFGIRKGRMSPNNVCLLVDVQLRSYTRD